MRAQSSPMIESILGDLQRERQIFDIDFNIDFTGRWRAESVFLSAL